MTLTRLRNFWNLLNLIELISGDHAVLTHSTEPTSTCLQEGRSVLFPQVPRAFHNGSVSWIILAFLSSPSCIQRGGDKGWDFAPVLQESPDQIGPETAISASKTCDMSRKSSIPHWYLLRFCSVQIESLTVRLFTLKFLCATRYQYAFTFLKPPHVIDLQTPRYRCPSKRQLLRSALLWIPKCINVTSPRFPSTRTWQRREEINYKMKHPRFWDDDNGLNGCRRL